MKKRNQIAKEYKWDLTSYISNEKEIENIFSIMEKLPQKIEKYSGKLNDKVMLLERLEKYRLDFNKIQILASYISNSLNLDSTDVKMIKCAQKFENLYQKILLANAYFTPQMHELSEDYLNSLLIDPKFKDHSNLISDIIKTIPHKIDEKTGVLLSKMSKFTNANSGLHSSMVDELKFEDIVDENGKKYKLDNANISKFLRGKNRTLRKNAYYSRLKAYKQFNKTFSNFYINDLEECKFNSQLSNFNSTLEAELFEDDIPTSVFENNEKFVNINLNLMQKFVKTQKKLSKLKDFSYFDLFVDDEMKKKFSVNEAKEIVLKALAPLGEEYLAIVRKKFSDCSIDYFPCEHKDIGGYCSSCYNAKTLILMNFVDDFGSVDTLIHEMGHCVNAEYFNAAQPMEKADVTIFAAEIASTVNEILLNLYMQAHAKTKKEKCYYLKHFLSSVVNTVFRQTLFSEFEHFAHEKIESEEPLTYEDLNAKYLCLTKKYYGSSCVIPSIQQYEWMRVPHFYSPFYVYTYSTGMLTAITIANNLINNTSYKDKYIAFLKNGTDIPAVEMLKKIGIDLTTSNPFENAFKFIETELKEYEKLTK